MSDQHHASDVNRREFLQTGTAATAVAATGMTLAPNESHAAPQASRMTLPRRPLGKTGAELTILNLGTWQSPGTPRLLRSAYDRGVRVIDTADCYGSEPAIAAWLQEKPEVRKEIFLVTKDHPRQGHEQLIPLLDKRLEALKVDSVDLIFIHGIGPGEYGQASLNWPKDPAFARTMETIKKSGKAKFVGFSCHDARRADYLRAAADGGFVDAIMLQHTAWLDPDTALNKAMDDCWKKGIGLISMKQVAGKPNVLDEVPKRIPDLKKQGLSPYQALLHAIWTDERITTCCVSMRNLDQIRENTIAATNFKPMEKAAILQLRDAVIAAGSTLCADCDGRCAKAGGTDAALGDLTRFLTYYEGHGDRAEALRQYAALPAEQRNWQGADLEAAREACPSKLDFARLLPRVDSQLA